MLALSRKVGQVVCVAGGVKVIVRAIRGSRVILGFEAPRGVRIVREELEIDANDQPSKRRLLAGVSAA